MGSVSHEGVAVWLTLSGGGDGDPSFRLKSGFSQDDNVSQDDCFSQDDKILGGRCVVVRCGGPASGLLNTAKSAKI
jgi:hypothetical protein